MIEKRKSPRVPVAIKVESHDPYEKLIFGYARDLSVSGMSVCSEVVSSFDAIPAIGETLTLSFKLPRSDHKVTVMGKLVRVDMYEGRLPVLGLHFTHIESASKLSIESYVSQSQLALFEKSKPEKTL